MMDYEPEKSERPEMVKMTRERIEGESHGD